MDNQTVSQEDISEIKEWIKTNSENLPEAVRRALRAVAPLTVADTGWHPTYHLRKATDQVGNTAIMLDELQDGRIAALNGYRVAFYSPGDLRPGGATCRLEKNLTLKPRKITTVEEYENLSDGSIIAYKFEHGGTTVAVKTEDDVWEMSSYCEMADNQAIAELFTNGAQVIRDGDA